ncbi:hypothetical protein P153DRAFT_362426 [Dothidotthia symphoricarpi CBS 119687]|uniref:Uncharacterized protein n=1 Tax=Dothidotthia symphoricarpi CBS 119687 TaxID=1392245 RepID=A0A6A6AVX8_9PLEO|nr:uncharacterized protein P153DRAFT_362426 [Dothidotthia symphoricarpi CBS 119687]KAF2134681.1 hypothetical protein P153DRAFT_362426 [Dothidotthia symphoricarpi CBS 119687]
MLPRAPFVSASIRRAYHLRAQSTSQASRRTTNQQVLSSIHSLRYGYESLNRKVNTIQLELAGVRKQVDVIRLELANIRGQLPTLSIYKYFLMSALLVGFSAGLTATYPIVEMVRRRKVSASS